MMEVILIAVSSVAAVVVLLFVFIWALEKMWDYFA